MALATVIHEFPVDDAGSIITCGQEGCPFVGLDVPAIQSHRAKAHGIDLGPNTFEEIMQRTMAARALIARLTG